MENRGESFEQRKNKNGEIRIRVTHLSKKWKEIQFRRKFIWHTSDDSESRFFTISREEFFWSLLCQLLPSDPFKLFVLFSSILERMLITKLPLPPNSHLFESFLDILNFSTVTCIYDFTDRGEFSNSRSYGKILEPLIIERETRNLLLSMFQSIFFSRYRVKSLSVNKSRV